MTSRPNRFDAFNDDHADMIRIPPEKTRDVGWKSKPKPTGDCPYCRRRYEKALTARDRAVRVIHIENCETRTPQERLAAAGDRKGVWVEDWDYLRSIGVEE